MDRHHNCPAYQSCSLLRPMFADDIVSEVFPSPVRTKRRHELLDVERFVAVSQLQMTSRLTREIDPKRFVLFLYSLSWVKTYKPDLDLSIDESLMKFLGHLCCYVKYNPSKGARFDIKFYKQRISIRFRCSDMRFYTAEKEGDRELPLVRRLHTTSLCICGRW